MKRIFGIILLVIGITLVGLPILTIFGISCSTDNAVTASADVESGEEFIFYNQINVDETFSFGFSFRENSSLSIYNFLFSTDSSYNFSLFDLNNNIYLIENHSFSSSIPVTEFGLYGFAYNTFSTAESFSTINSIQVQSDDNGFGIAFFEDLIIGTFIFTTFNEEDLVSCFFDYFNDVPTPTPTPTPSAPEWTGNYYQDAVDLFASVLGVSPGSFMYTVIEILAIFFCVVIIAIPLLFVFAIILWIISLIRPRC